jgi:hypothetical protein
MSVWAATVPDMDDMAQLAGSVTGFAAAENLTIVPAVPEQGYGPMVCLGSSDLSLLGFLELAANLGGGVLYLRAMPFDPAAADDLPAHLAGRKGQTGEVSVAFAANGVVHFWDQAAAWFLEWEELTEGASPRPGFGLDRVDEAGRLSDEERARLVGELVDAVLADPQFRAASHGKRQRIARQAVPEGPDQWAAWEVAREACERAQEMTEDIYGQLEGRLDELAAGLLASPGWQQASSPPARRQAAGRFLIPLADGFAPPSSVREELYARARDLAKAASTSGSGLF